MSGDSLPVRTHPNRCEQVFYAKPERRLPTVRLARDSENVSGLPALPAARRPALSVKTLSCLARHALAAPSPRTRRRA